MFIYHVNVICILLGFMGVARKANEKAGNPRRDTLGVA